MLSFGIKERNCRENSEFVRCTKNFNTSQEEKLQKSNSNCRINYTIKQKQAVIELHATQFGEKRRISNHTLGQRERQPRTRLEKRSFVPRLYLLVPTCFLNLDIAARGSAISAQHPFRERERNPSEGYEHRRNTERKKRKRCKLRVRVNRNRG